jgi:integrase
MRAAYSLALRADLEPGAPSALLGFNLQSNPIAPTGALAQYSRALDRVLTREELGAYVRRVQGLPEGIVKDALRLHLVLGGQRLSQMLRVTVADYDSDAKTLLLRDTKGARKQPRAHFVPLVEDAATILKRIVTARQKAGWKLIFTFDGKEQLKRDALTSAAVDIRAEMKKAKEVRADFSLRDLRRTVETVLAGMGVSRETRAQIQSHGLGGVQQRHYDRHDYMTEKRNALKAWVRRLRDVAREKKKAPTNVVDIKKGRPRQAKVAA